MERQFDIFINGAYIGRAPHDACRALCTSEMERPTKVHGVVIEDSDPPRLVLNPTHDESPALVRRVVEAMSTGPDNLKAAAHAFERAINAEPGIEVELQQLDISTHADPNRSRWHLVVTRNERKQVYP